MSYVYSFYNCISPYPQALFSLYPQTHLQNSLQPLCLVNNSSSLTQFKNPQKFNPILISTHTTCQNLSSNEHKTIEKRETKQIKKEIYKNKDQNFGWRNQNKQRNLISSILKGFVHYVLQERGMVKFIEEIAKKRQIENGVSRLYEFMAQKFPIRKSYVGLRYMQQTLTSSPSSDPVTFILSLTLRHYLKEIYPLFIIQNCKTKKKSRLALLKKARTISSTIFAQ